MSFRRHQSFGMNKAVFLQNRTAEFLNAPTRTLDLIVKGNTSMAGNLDVAGNITGKLAPKNSTPKIGIDNSYITTIELFSTSTFSSFNSYTFGNSTNGTARSIREISTNIENNGIYNMILVNSSTTTSSSPIYNDYNIEFYTSISGIDYLHADDTTIAPGETVLLTITKVNDKVIATVKHLTSV